MTAGMDIEDAIGAVLPEDLPERDRVVAKTAAHLRMIQETNERFNLTRITSPEEAAVKHVLDSLLPWRLFAGARRVLDAGTGAGFPGIPLAVALPRLDFTLADSTQKKARFVESAVEALGLPNAKVSSRRAEDISSDEKFDIVAARAVAPLIRAIPLFASAAQKGARILLYKGPDIELEIEEAAQEARKRKLRVEIVMRYELPGGYGSRTIVELTAKR